MSILKQRTGSVWLYQKLQMHRKKLMVEPNSTFFKLKYDWQTTIDLWEAELEMTSYRWNPFCNLHQVLVFVQWDLTANFLIFSKLPKMVHNKSELIILVMIIPLAVAKMKAWTFRPSFQFPLLMVSLVIKKKTCVTNPNWFTL